MPWRHDKKLALFLQTTQIINNMKTKFLSLLCVAALCASCAQTYHFVQVFETQSSNQSAPVKQQNGGLVYEDDECLVFYSLWAHGGDASFGIYNKTDQIMYVDLSKSFFIRNGIANDYYKERAWGETTTNSTSTQVSSSIAASANLSYSYGASAAYLGNFGDLPFTTYDPIFTSVNAQKSETYGYLRSAALANTYAISTSSSISAKEQKIIALPPHSSKIVSEYAIANVILLDCDLDRYPSEKASISFEENNSPLHFSNYITYRLGDNQQDRIIENNFYVSKIINYARPYTYEYVERANRPCQNLTDDDSKNYKETYPVKVYDKIYKFDTGNCFYLEYEKQSSRKLYKADNTIYYYNELYNGYTTSGSDQQSDYQQRLLNPFKQGWK